MDIIGEMKEVLIGSKLETVARKIPKNIPIISPAATLNNDVIIKRKKLFICNNFISALSVSETDGIKYELLIIAAKISHTMKQIMVKIIPLEMTLRLFFIEEIIIGKFTAGE